MGTRSSITAKTSDGKFKSVYCHFDGYLSNNGKILLASYNTQEKVDELLSHGDMSSLGNFCDKPEGHSYNNPAKDRCTYYGRDRGETGTEAREGETAGEAAKGNKQEYNYVWEGASWSVSFHDRDALPLREAVEGKADESDE